MSGIAGAVWSDRAATQHELTAMLQAMASRGPDRQALLCADNAGFGQALLATTPEALAEHQPWRHPDSGCIIVSDSRLDNRPQLLRELGINQPADAVGDGQLLHAAWQRWQEGCADRLRGDFAFAIWNPRDCELFIARDPMGVRPLAFHHRPGHVFVFASSADAVLAQGHVPRDLDEGRIADALIQATEGIDQTCTFFTSVQRLPPAHWLRLRDGSLTTQRYWRPIGDRPNGLPQQEAEWIEAQREQLDRAVRLRLRSQRPVGSMLSGGLDSSSVVALASAACIDRGQVPLPVFSATNSADPDCPETRNIRAVIDHVTCKPTYIDLSEYKCSIDPAQSWWHRVGEPFDTSMTLVGAIYDTASARKVPSVLDGMPADNLFVIGQYPRRLVGHGRWREAWSAALKGWQRPGIVHPRAHALRVMAGCITPAAGHAMWQHLAIGQEYRAMMEKSLIHQSFARRVHMKQRYRLGRRAVGQAHHWHETTALSSMTASYITAAVERYNRVASVFGVEPRHPYADRDLIEFAAWMPIALRHNERHAKWVLRKAMSGLLPTQVVWRKDNSHLGWSFNRAEFKRLRQAGLGCEHMPHLGWLDTKRLAAACNRADTQITDELLAAIGLSLWYQRISR